MQIKGHGYATDALTKEYTKIIQDFQGKKNVKFHEIPDSGISSTTSITDDENKTNTTNNNNNKRKIEDPPIIELDGTFTLTNSTTPNKPKSKGTATDQIISKGGIGYNFFGGLATELIHGVFYNINMKKN